ncbi:MAG: chemotaxis protein CheX [Paraburkholderia sp.]|nr:chemotaxis protein CheX [Paraburkholderia sp.]
MTDTNTPISKILILDDNQEHAQVLKQFCDERSLVALKARHDRLMSVLRSNIDLGGVLLSDDYGGSVEEATNAALRIEALRPELPIILRRSFGVTQDILPTALRNAVCATFATGAMPELAAAVDEYIFSLEFPNALVRGISEITEARLASLFRGFAVTWDTPSIVRDRIIFGEVFSLIPLDGAWCRGYMLMQVEEDPLLAIIESENPHDISTDFHDINALLGELTNLIWGAFKDRFLNQEALMSRSQVQVPLLVNHKNRYISFGSSNPQLCFRYRVTNEATGNSATIDQRFIFSLRWSPEDFSENVVDIDSLVEAGELDLF